MFYMNSNKLIRKRKETNKNGLKWFDILHNTPVAQIQLFIEILRQDKRRKSKEGEKYIEKERFPKNQEKGGKVK